MDGMILKDKNPQEQIDSFFIIRNKDNHYELNVRTNDEQLILKVLEKENKFIEYFEEELTITDIQNKHKIFKSYQLFKKFVDYIKTQKENNKLKILKINNESILIRLGQENIEFILKKKTFDKETIKKNVLIEIIKNKIVIKNLEEKNEKLNLDNKSKEQKILNLETKINELEKEKENEELKSNNRPSKEENQKLNEKNINNVKNNDKNNNKIKKIQQINLKKDKSNPNKIKDVKSFTNRDNIKAKLEGIKEVSKKNRQNEIKRNNTQNNFYHKKGINITTNKEKNSNKDNRTSSNSLNKKNIVKYLSNNYLIPKGNSRTKNKNISNYNGYNNDHNRTFIGLETYNINNNNDDNLCSKKNVNNENRIKTEENIDYNKKRNFSNKTDRNEIEKYNLIQINPDHALTPIKYPHNYSNNKSNNSKIIQDNKYESNHRMNPENNEDKSNKTTNRIHTNQKINRRIINDKNNNIKPIKNKLELKDNSTNYNNILNHNKDFPFIHVILKCLTNIKPLVKNFLYNKEEIKKNNNQLPLSNLFLEIIENLWENESIKEYTLINYINKKLYQKNKFFNEPKGLVKFILVQLYQELRKVKDINSEFIEEFDDDLDKNINNCGKENQLRNMLEFSLEEVKEYNNIKGKDITINDCFKLLQSFYKYNKFDKCYKEQIMSYNNILLGELKFLIININTNNKIENKFAIENEIDLNNFFDFRENKYKYELISIMRHLGDDHFISFCKSFFDYNWIKYDEYNSKITSCSFEEVKSQGTPYLLFYSLIEN